MLLHELCLNHYLAGQVDCSCEEDKDESAVELSYSVSHHSESLSLLDNLEHVIKKTTEAVSNGEVCGSSREVSDDPSSPLDVTNSNSQSPTNNSPLIKGPMLYLGSKQNIWLDFGSDQYNFVGRMRSLPVVLHAPGKLEEDTSEPFIYFDVEIGGRPPYDSHQSYFYFSMGDKIFDRADDHSSSIQFTMIEGGSELVYVTWNPACEGGMREVIPVKTSFSGTEENIAVDEIIVVGCAKNDLEEHCDHVVADVDKSQHFDLAQSPVGRANFERSDDKLSHDEESSQQNHVPDVSEANVEQHGNDSQTLDEEGRQHEPAFDASETNVGEQHQHDSQALDDESNGENLSMQTLALGQSDVRSVTTTTAHEDEMPQDSEHSTALDASKANAEQHGNDSKALSDDSNGENIFSQNQAYAKSHVKSSATTTDHKQQPKHIVHGSFEMNQRLAQLRAQRAVTTSRTSRGALPLRATHPAANCPGPAPRANFLKYNRYTRPQTTRQANALKARYAQPEQTEASSLDKNRTSEEVEDDDLLNSEKTTAEAASELINSNLPDDILVHDFGSPATKAMLKTMVDVGVEGDAAKITPTPLNKDEKKTTNASHVFTFEQDSSPPRTRLDTDDKVLFFLLCCSYFEPVCLV